MKISDLNPGGAAASGTQRSQETQPAAHGGPSRASGAGFDSDRVEFSGGLGSLSRALSSFHSDRAGRVQSLAAQYQNGTYRPDSAAISRGLVGEALGSGSL
jgi:hypothetical protein